MEKSLDDFLVYGGRNSEYTLKYLTKLLNKNHQYPPHIVEIIQNIRLHAEEDYSNFLHLQSILPHTRPSAVVQGPPGAKRGESRAPPLSLPSGPPPIHEETGLSEEQGDEAVETAVSAGDDLFLLEGVQELRSPQSLTFSDGDEGEESEGDEGIHIPRKHEKPHSQTEIAASLPVGIPWQEKMTIRRTPVNNNEPDEMNPKDIAASIQAMAKSVHTSSMFGDSVFGDLPRPRRNTASKD